MKQSDSHEARISPDQALRMEAADWLLRLTESEADPEDPYKTSAERHAAFMRWIKHSKQHLQIFFEIVETHRRLPMVNLQGLIDVERLLTERHEDVIHLYGESTLSAKPSKMEAMKPPKTLRRRAIFGAAAALVVGLTGGLYWILQAAHSYTTAVGEQRQAKLDDGSFIYLNTDSRVEVTFTNTARNIRLLRGEALFVVEKDTRRPFIVSTGTAKVRAVGTEFNVRRLNTATDISVIEGVVQVNALGDHLGAIPSTPVANMQSKMLAVETQLKAGEGARVAQGQVIARSAGVESAVEPLVWRQRRLKFKEALLNDVAEEFNRYNRAKIRVEGAPAREILISGIFDADRPQVLIMYATRNDALVVEPDGKDWVIRAR